LVIFGAREPSKKPRLLINFRKSRKRFSLNAWSRVLSGPTYQSFSFAAHTKSYAPRSFRKWIKRREGLCLVKPYKWLPHPLSHLQVGPTALLQLTLPFFLLWPTTLSIPSSCPISLLCSPLDHFSDRCKERGKILDKESEAHSIKLQITRDGTLLNMIPQIISVETQKVKRNPKP
jgi:hypothetical protein